MIQQHDPQARRYRAYMIDDNDRISNFRAINAADDPSAIEATRALIDGQPLELWDGPRKILRVEPRGPQLR